MKKQEAERLYDSLTHVEDRFLREMEEDSEVHQKKHPVWAKWGTLAACAAVVFVSAIAFFPHGESHGRGNSDISPNPPISGSSVPEEEPVSVSMSGIVTNELAPMQTDYARVYRDPELYDEIDWDKKEVAAYYGKDLTPPYVPEGLKPSPVNGTGYAWIQRSDGQVVEDEVGMYFYHDYYEDGNPKCTEDVPAAQGFHIRASKLGLFHCGLYLTPEDEVKTSDIGGIPVTIGYRSMSYGSYEEPDGFYDLYVAEFQLDGIEYQVVAEQMELKELVKVVASMIYGEQEVLLQP